MRIGIDIDDTITNTQEVIDEIAQTKESRKIYDRTKHWFTDRFNCTQEDDDKFFYKYATTFMAEATIKEGASEYINKLHDEGYEIYIITSRSDFYSPEVLDITIDYLDKNDIKYDKIIFKSQNKAEICKNNNIDIMIDDAVEHINEITDIGIKVIIMDNEYNRNASGVRAHSWKEVYEIIKGGD